MKWTTITHAGSTNVNYMAQPERGIKLRIDPVLEDDWPAFRWSADINVEGYKLHSENTAVDLASAKFLAEAFVTDTLPKLRKH
jgi:hypothetical protein